ncbi:uncharacterized protein LOC115738583 [Rhodamnia argentea]|uniref:Uncharacterized protein LOC115738583 n=1 Tax=Rhodamnia argentea TaxID=178133 RepID=A0A8B8NX20_9MYRT|nr:uncharacterized protein LOC115738583 [Rhodamnia argentea]
MAFIPQSYSHFSTFAGDDLYAHESLAQAVEAGRNVGGPPLWSAEELLPRHGMLSSQQHQKVISSVPTFQTYATDFHEERITPAFPEAVINYGSSSYGVVDKPQSFGNLLSRDDQSYVCELLGNGACPFMSGDFEPTHRAAGDHCKWNIKVQEEPLPEECNLKVGRYSVEERKRRILRYLKKRNERNFNKTIKYACRKSLADRRVRIRGRFARNSNSCAEGMAAAKKNEYPQLEKDLFFGDDVQMKRDEEDEWVQEALADLLYLPYTSAAVGDRYLGAYETML